MAKERRSLAGKVVAITGGARGIGEATARAIVAKGGKVAIGDLDVELAQKTAGVLGGGTIALELDVTRRDSFESFISQVEERLGPLDVLINNAGIMPIGPFVDEDDATARRMIDINLHGVIFGTKLAIPGMVRRGSGHIVNIASQAGKGGFPGGATYCATKHAVVGPLRGRPRRAARHRRRGLVRDAGRRQHRARLGPGRDPRRSRSRSRTTSPTRSSTRSRRRSSTSGCPRSAPASIG